MAASVHSVTSESAAFFKTCRCGARKQVGWFVAHAEKCRQLPGGIQHRQLRRSAGFAPLVALGQTLASWPSEIAAMWRFTRNNGITEGFHIKMEVLERQAYGFRNLQNYRLRVRVMRS
jgi:transposase